MKIYKFFKKLCLLILLILVLPIKIEAKHSYEYSKLADGMVDIKDYHSSYDDNEIVLCAYKCSEENQEYCYDTDFSAITYNHIDADKNTYWEISLNIMAKPASWKYNSSGEVEDVPSEFYSFIWKEIGPLLTSSGIYFEKPSKNNVNEGWKKGNLGYDNLHDNFVCPNYLYFDHTIKDPASKKNDMELCYANEKELCKYRNEDDITKFGKANNLSYSFNEELNEILDAVILDLETDAPDKSLRIYFGLNEDTVCSMLEYDTDTFIDKMRDENLLNYINEKINYATPLDSINRSFYNYENITKLLNPDQKNSKHPNLFIMYNNQKLKEKYDKIESIYTNNISESLKKYADQCSIIGHEVNVDSSVVEEKLEEKFEKLVVNYDNIDFSELNCENIFAEFADIIKTAYFIIELLAILLAVVLTIVDYAKIILSDNQDEMKKSNKNLMIRLIIVAVILLLPALINMILKTFRIQGFDSDTPLCIEIKK